MKLPKLYTGVLLCALVYAQTTPPTYQPTQGEAEHLEVLMYRAKMAYDQQVAAQTAFGEALKAVDAGCEEVAKAHKWEDVECTKTAIPVTFHPKPKPETKKDEKK
jgi:hypothetical protein